MTNNMTSYNKYISSCNTLYTDGMQTVEHKETMRKGGLQMLKRACKTISPYNM